MTMNTGNVYIQGPTGFEPLGSVTEFTDVTTTMDEAREKNIIPMNPEKPYYTMTFTLLPHAKRRLRRAISGWRASGPLRWQQWLRAVKEYRG